MRNHGGGGPTDEPSTAVTGMRILLVSDHYPPFIGGAQRQTKVLAQRLHDRGHDVAVATVWQDDLPSFELDGHVQVFRLKQLRSAGLIRGRPRRRYQPPFPDPVTVFELRRLVRSFGPDLVHAAGWFSFSCAAALVRDRTPLVISARDYGFSCAKTTLIHRGTVCSGPAVTKCWSCAGRYYGRPRGWIAALGVLASRPLLRRRATALHSVSRYVEDIVRRDFLDTASARRILTEVIPSFRVEDPAYGDPAVLDRLPPEPFILFVGALRRVKGVEILLKAYARLPSPPPLVLIGTVESDTPRDIPPGTVIIDGLPHWAVLAAWERSLFGVMPSLWPEPFGSVVHEAMSRAKAVIGTEPGGHSDMVIHEKTGLLVPAGDVGALTAAMARLLDEPAFREQLGRHAAEHARSFAEAAVVPRFDDLYRRVAGRLREADT